MVKAPKTPFSGIILAGGLGSRFSGRDKALLEWNGRPLLDHIRQAFGGFFQEIILVTNTPGRFAAWDMTLVTDLFAERSSLTGIHAGLFYASHPYGFVTACDTPFLQPALISTLLDATAQAPDVVVPKTDQGLEPLCAVYSQRCLTPITHRLEQGDFRIRSFFRKVRVHTVGPDRLRQADPDLRSFYNINTIEDLEGAGQRFANARGREATSD
ncbi:MAG: molybdenum cofactor guanylyltransferase [Desulfobacterales bacterium]|jgi:molybdopterin-guanine dinucleotide biosynthesis protein A